ncbi:catalase-like protein [Leptotrombidium deliense]|uniref:Catalase-like protein n=1 Tax=Leptotrombidium deliense TaxID=299467 RepID=A0A443S717_9ACAR|nr:catalase-like protein [Leptotrombidium deliense]
MKLIAKFHFLGTDPDYAIRDLFNAIASKNFASWTFSVQIMTNQQAENLGITFIHKLCKGLSHAVYPNVEVSKLVLDRNLENYFAEVEQLAFSPSNMVPIIGPYPNKMLQTRLFAYNGTHRHRDGPYCFDNNGGGMPNYFANSFLKAKDNLKYIEHRDQVTIPDIDRHESANEDNYTQVANFWQKVLKEDEK